MFNPKTGRRERSSRGQSEDRKDTKPPTGSRSRSGTTKEVDSDLQLAMKLQAKFDAEASNTSAPESGRRRGKQSSLNSYSLEQSLDQMKLDSDTELAMKLQAEFDAEADNASPSPPGRRAMNQRSQNSHSMTQPPSTQYSSKNHLSPYGKSAYDTSKDATVSLQSSPQGALENYEQIANAAIKRVCLKCNTNYIGTQESFIGLFRGWICGHHPISSIVRCRACSDNTSGTCLGCGTRENPKRAITKEKTRVGLPVSWCCPRGRLFLIWAVTSGHDYLLWQEKTETDNRALSAARQPKLGGRGVGYGGGSDEDFYEDMRDFMRFGHQSKTSAQGAKTKASNAQLQSDSFNTGLLACLSLLLPKGGKRSELGRSYDTDPPAAIESIIINSRILDRIVAYLRNDSIEDVAQRKNIYDQVFEFLRLIGSHEQMGKILFQERVDPGEGINLLTRSYGQIKTKGKSKPETGNPVFSYLKNLNTQSEIMLRGAQMAPKEFATDKAKIMLSICTFICKIWKLLSLSPGACMATSTGARTTENVECGIIEASYDLLMSNFYYASQAKQSAPKSGMKRLLTELTTLKTGLPPGIFIKFAESRMDLMKILIVGPAGTPYELGLFEFDLYCDNNYPNVSPHVKFRTTGRGTVSFNPNLYSNGKVCLSLLGTWAGERWRPGESTILQVLVSIQAMIFCEEPICNEPGSERLRGSTLSRIHNLGYRYDTVGWAMIDWMKERNPFWQDVINLHFKKHGAKILQNVTRWAQDTSKQLSGKHQSHLPMMSAAIRDITPLLPHLTNCLAELGVCQSVPVGAALPTVSQRGPPPPFLPPGVPFASGSTPFPSPGSFASPFGSGAPPHPPAPPGFPPGFAQPGYGPHAPPFLPGSGQGSGHPGAGRGNPGNGTGYGGGVGPGGPGFPGGGYGRGGY